MSFRDKSESHQWDTPNWTRRGLYETLRETINDEIRGQDNFGAPDWEVDRIVDALLTVAIGGAVSQEETLGFGDEDIIPLRFGLLREVAFLMANKWSGEDELPKPPRASAPFPEITEAERAALLHALGQEAKRHADAIEERTTPQVEREFHVRRGKLLKDLVGKIIGVMNYE